MGSTSLGPLKRTLKKAYGLAANIEQEVAGLVQVVDQTNIDAVEFEEHFKKAEEAARQLMQTIRQGKAKAREMKELPSAADKIADTIMIAEGMDSLLAGMPSYQLARELEMVRIDSYQMALRELGSYESGVSRLVELRDCAEKVLQEILGKQE